jgi:hypothetical protein
MYIWQLPNACGPSDTQPSMVLLETVDNEVSFQLQNFFRDNEATFQLQNFFRDSAQCIPSLFSLDFDRFFVF